MASSSSTSRSWSYDVFPSFRGEDVRKSFLSYLLKELHRKSVHTFIDNGIERSRTIAPELLLAIEESRISIVVFSRNYASSTWCLNELVHIHKCCTENSQMVIPIFYDVDPSHVRKQSGEFGKAFEETCKGKAEDDKERWIRALVEVANMAGYDSQNWDNEADMTEKISTDVSDKLNNTAPLDDFADYVGIEAHLEKLNSMLCLESGGVRMVGIVGTSGIGKSTIARALFNKLSSQFDLRSLKPYKRTLQDRKVADINVKLSWAKQFLSDILCQNDIKIDSLSVVEQRLKHKKVLIILDDVDEKELLETLVGQPGWFGFGSRIIVVTQDRELLKSHKISLVYDVELPSEDLALQMFCRAAFGQNSPRDGFKDLAYEVVKLSGKLPLGVKVLGSTLSEKSEKEWREMLPRLQDGLDSKIERTLRVSYDGLDRKDQDIFLHIACLFNGAEVGHIKNMLGNNALTILVDRSLITIRPSTKTVEMHGLLEQLGREIVRAEFRDNPEKRRFLMDAKDILDVLADYDTGTNIVGIHLNTLKIRKTIDEKSFVGMRNLQFLKVYIQEGWNHYDILLPPKLRLLHWEKYPAKPLPCSFSGEYLVELIMKGSWLNKLWEGTKPLRSLKKIILDGSMYLKEIPDLSNATNLETLSLVVCTSLVELPSTIRNLKNLIKLHMNGCSNLKSLPPDVNLESLDELNLRGYSNLRFFPRYSRNISRLGLDGTAMKEEDCLWIENLSRLKRLCWDNCPLRYMPSNFHTEHLVELDMSYSKLEKLWEGVKPLWSLEKMILHGSQKLKEIPDLSNATSLIELSLYECTSLVELPSTIRNLKKLIKLDMYGCSNLESLPTDVNLESLEVLDLTGCSSLKFFPRISKTISIIHLDGTAMEEEDCLSIENLSMLTILEWRSCRLRCMSPDFHPEDLIRLTMCDSKLEKLWEGVQPLGNLEYMDLSGCENLREIPDLSKANNLERLKLRYCTSLEDLPTNIDLVSLISLDLTGCSRLKSFPQFSTSITYLHLDYTAIKEIPSWIENMSRLEHLTVKGCEMLKISAKFRNLRHLDRFKCGSKTAVSNANLAKLLAELHPASIQFYTQEIISSSDDTEFLLARGSQEYILQRNFRYAIVPGKQVPRWYFKHQNRGSSLTVPLPQSSQQNLEFAGCIILGHINLGFATDDITIFVHWKFKGVKGICKIKPCIYRDLMYHLIVFHFDFNNGEEFDGPSSQFDCNNVEFEFEVHYSLEDCCCYKIFGTEDRNLETCPIFPQRIEECGIRVLSVIPSLDANETEDNPQDGEESDGRMRMTVKTSQEPSNSLCGETAVESGLMAPNLELSLGLCGASDHVSSRGKVPLPSIPSSNLLGDGPSLSLSLTPDPCLSGETLHSNPMITDQQDTEPFVDPLSSPHIINFFCQTPAPDFDHSSVSFYDDGPLLSLSLTPSDACLAEETLHSKPMITDQQDTETPFVDPSSSPQLINFFSQNLLPNLDLTSSLGGSSSNFHGDGTSPYHSLSPFHPCREEQTLYVDPMTTEQLDRGGTNCQSFILFTASKLFQILEITFRQVSNLFCCQTGDSSNSVPRSSYSTPSNAPELFVFSSSGNSRVAEDKRLYKKVVKKQKIPKRNVFSSPRLKHTACVMNERTHTRENLEKVVVSA